MIIRLFIALLFLPLFSGATHLVGGEMYYEHLGNNNYRVTLKVYRDCGPNNTIGTGFDQTATIGVFSNGILQQTLQIPFPGSSQLPVVINNPCLSTPPNICIEEAVYRTTVNLPPANGGYDLVYQRCCRNPAIQNIVNPSDYGNSYLSHIPGPQEWDNSSPYFNNYPPLVLCAGEQFVFDHSATDPDGDQLEYEFFTPYHGGSSTNPMPVPPVAPPFGTVLWQGGFNTNYQLPSSPALTIDPNTGQMTCTPTQTGIYVVGVKVKEYRNGALISETIRDFQFYVTNCDPVVVAAIPDQSNDCGGLTVQLNSNGSVNAQNFYWDFGDGNTSTDPDPSHTYANPGVYNIMLIANPGWTCADTAYSVYNMFDPISPSFAEVDPQCITGNSFDFSAEGNFDPTIATFDWDFGPNALPQTSTLENPSGIVFQDSGRYPVTLTITNGGCDESFTDTVIVFPVPELIVEMPPAIGCQPYEATFNDLSIAWTPIDYVWNFGDGTLSTQANPVHTYNNVGVYPVSVTIQIDSGCVDTITQVFPNAITVNPSPVAAFDVSPDERTVFQPNFELFDQSQGAMLVYYSIYSDTIYQRNGEITLTDTGFVPIVQWAVNEYGCIDTTTEYVYVEPVSTIYAPNAFTPNSNGTNDVWKPLVRDLNSYELFIYDRWGNLLFRTDDPDQGWDGTFKGKRSPVDTYVYRIFYQPVDNILREKTGHITLVR